MLSPLLSPLFYLERDVISDGVRYPGEKCRGKYVGIPGLVERS